MFVRLRLPNICFFDPETRFRLESGEVKELPNKVGILTRQAMNAGGIIIVPSSEQKVSSVSNDFDLKDKTEIEMIETLTEDTYLEETPLVSVSIEKNSEDKVIQTKKRRGRPAKKQTNKK